MDNFNIFKGTDYLVLYSPYLQNYLSYLVIQYIILKLKKPSLMVNFRTEHPFCVQSHMFLTQMEMLKNLKSMMKGQFQTLSLIPRRDPN